VYVVEPRQECWCLSNVMMPRMESACIVLEVWDDPGESAVGILYRAVSRMPVEYPGMS